MDPSLDVPLGKEWERTRDGSYRKRIFHDGEYCFQYFDTGEIVRDQAAKPKPKPIDSTIPRSQLGQQRYVNSVPAPLPNTTAATIGRGTDVIQAQRASVLPQGDRIYNKHTGSIWKNYEVTKRDSSRSRTRQENPKASDSSLTIRKRTSFEKDNESNEPKHTGEPFRKRRLLPELVSTFVSIPAGAEGFVRCRDLVDDYPELISHAQAQVYSIVLQAHHSGDKPRFRQCLERYVMITECNKRSERDREKYLDRLADKDESTAKNFYEAYAKEESKIRQLPTAGFAPFAGQKIHRRDVDYAARVAHAAGTPPEGTMPLISQSSSRPHVQNTEQNMDSGAQFTSSRYNPHTRQDPVLGDPYHASHDPNQQREDRMITSRANQGRGTAPRRESVTGPQNPITSSQSIESPQFVSYTVASTRQDRQSNKSYHHGPTSQLTLPTSNAGYSAPQHNRGNEGQLDYDKPVETFSPIRRVTSSSRNTLKRSIASGDDDIPRLETVNLGDVDVTYDEQLRAFQSQHRKLDPEYKLQPSSFFVKGRVFLITWPENHGESRNSTSKRRSSDSRTLTGPLGEPIFSHPVRMVVVQVKKGGYSHCIRINSYRKQGTLKNLPEYERNAHAVIYSDKMPQAPVGEAELTKDPIAVVMENSQTLDSASRIHFGKIYTVEHNVRVKPVGRIAPRSMAFFNEYFNKENFPTGSNNLDS